MSNDINTVNGAAKFACPLCRAGEQRELWSGPGYRLVRCCGCGLVFRDTLPDADQYQGQAYFEEYLARRGEFIAIFKEIMGHVARFQQPPGLLLDVGCSVGLLLEAAQEAGWQAEGVEVSRWAASVARKSGYAVVNSGLVAARLPASHYDAVVVNHVLEHVPHPVELVKECERILKPGGLLVVGAPNFGSLMARIEREHWPALQPGEHIWQFSPGTLGLMLRRCGFRPVGRQSGMQPRSYRRSPKELAKRLLYALAYRCGSGEVMTVFARREPVK